MTADDLTPAPQGPHGTDPERAALHSSPPLAPLDAAFAGVVPGPAPALGGPAVPGPRLAPAAVLGVAAAVLATLAWFLLVVTTEYQVGIVAVGVGAAIGAAARSGAGRVGGRGLQALAVGITLVTMAVAEYFIARAFLVEYLATEGVDGVPLLLPGADPFWLMFDSVAADPLTLAFWLAAVVAALRLTAARPADDAAGATAAAV